VNPYEGLNLPQLLELMHERVVPEPIPWMPQTGGWWILAAWLGAIILILAVYAYRKWAANAYRREALQALKDLAAHAQADPTHTATQIAILVKRTALAAYPRQQVAPLYGDQWAEFLREAARDDPVIDQAADELARAAYRADVDGAALVAPARRWIRVHRG
jgi:hypothetical protein